MSARDQLLVVIDPVARRTDGESVRIAKDVLGAGAAVRVCLPDGPEDFTKALARRGARRLVVIGDDRALLRAVAALHRERDLAGCALSVVPVGAAQTLTLTRGLGVPTGAVAAARTVLEGAERRLDLLVDDSDGVVLGDLRIPPVGADTSDRSPAEVDDVSSAVGAAGSSRVIAGRAGVAAEGHAWLRSCQSFVRTLATRPVRPSRPAPPARLRVEADGVTLVGLDQPVEGVRVTAGGGGLARVEVHPSPSAGAGASPVRVRARTVTVSGADFRYRADAVVAGPVRTRTWTVRARAWGLTLPR
ncbi:diacylglycerol kinase family protein [Streptomyces sp. Je 1-369]|uniref:diacylglycerol kinase family protein n=1 Tax=Streptomyces sp. Je 1-369 TaxID=2966192 RepID=UPI0022860155|nr:diacylglycerol kinase family protein [Streptomyces sp. Je 1-369]WAL96801.1 diacylglycerol kinase [Streptomyces sp. Je 1-369]